MSPRRPRTAEDDAAFKGMGMAIVHIREQRGMDREELAAKIEEEPAILGKIERGEVNADWATLRVIAYALDLPLDALMELAEESAPGRAATNGDGGRGRLNRRERGSGAGG